MMSEEWRSVPGYEGLYDVSSLGRVYSRSRARSSLGTLRGRYLKTPVNKSGYPEVHLYGTYRHTWRVHALVCLAFLGPCPDGLEIRHLDGNKLNPELANLTYGTRSENMLDIVRHGNHNMASKTHCKRGHELMGTNVYLTPRGSRQCRPCVRICRQLRQAS